MSSEPGCLAKAKPRKSKSLWWFLGLFVVAGWKGLWSLCFDKLFLNRLPQHNFTMVSPFQVDGGEWLRADEEWCLHVKPCFFPFKCFLLCLLLFSLFRFAGLQQFTLPPPGCSVSSPIFFYLLSLTFLLFFCLCVFFFILAPTVWNWRDSRTN